MQSVNERWYILYTRVATALAVVLVLASVTSWFLPGFKPFAVKWGLSYTTFGIAFAQILYVLLFYRGEARTNSYWSATLILTMFQALNIINLIHNTGQFHSWYLIYWVFAILMCGMFGNYVVVGCCFLVTIYFILISTDKNIGRNSIDIYSLAGVFVTYILGAASYMGWRRLYVDQESSQVAQLSGALKSKQQQTEILIQSIADGMIVINTEGKINMLNPAAADMIEWPIEEATGIDVQLVMKVAHENGEEIAPSENPFVRVLTQKQPVNETLKLTGRSGKQIIVSLVISPVIMPKNQELAGAVAVMRDISSAKAEEKRRADFISTASHEMRTPVAAIEGYLALALNDKVAQIDTKAREYLEKAHASTKHLGTLFQDLLTSAKAEDGRLVSHPVVVEMGAFLEQLSDSFRFAAEKKGLLMEFIIGAGKPDGSAGGGKVIKPLYYVHVDPERLREVITNLFDNAIKYTPGGKVSLGLTGNEELVQLYVRDTGPGIAGEDIPHLFQKFYRIDNSNTRTVGGTGLGLFICRKIIELYKGRIWVESQLGQGSTFYINLPRLSSQRATELQTQEASRLPGLPASGDGNGPI
jgi:PAS domain S-box-containing protein